MTSVSYNLHFFQILSVAVAVTAVVASAILVKIYLSRKKKRPVTLENPDVKYPLKLVYKEVYFFIIYHNVKNLNKF